MTALVLLPGMDGSGALFAGFLSHLGEGVRPIVVSYPGDRPLGYLELEAFASAFLPANEPFVLLGESFSGPVAIALAASRPAGLIGLVLSCTYCSNPMPWFRPLKRLLGLLPVSGRLTALTAPFLLGRFSSPVLRASLKQALGGVSARTMRARMHAALDVDFSGKIKEIDVPILYLQALGDLVVLPFATRRLLAMRPSIDVIKRRAPHLMLQALPGETAAIVEKFILRVSGTGPMQPHAAATGIIHSER